MKKYFCFLFFVFFFWVGNANAFLMDLIGVNDSVRQAASETRETISHARTEAQILMREGDEIAYKRIEQIDRAVDDALLNIALLEEKTSEDVLKIIRVLNRHVVEIEKKLFEDLNKSLWQAECGAKRLIIEDAQIVLGDLGVLLGTNRIRITPAILPQRSGFEILCPWCSRKETFEIDNDFSKTYIAVRDYMLENIDDNMVDETPAYALVGTYDYLSSFALKATCFYPHGSVQMMREHIKFKNLSAKWTDILIVEVML